MTIDRKNIILDSIKPAQDRSGDLILRFYESMKAAGKAKIKLSFGKKVWETDLLENKEEELNLENGERNLNFNAFEIKTVRILMEEK